MQFLYPSFLWALFALLIPIIIHLFNFKRYRTVYFSNNRFLQALQKKSKSFNKLKHWIILVSRLLALSCLVLAFAQPFFPAKEKTGQQSSFASIYIDNSLSMKSKGINASLLEDARAEAVNLVKALPKEFKIQIITNDLGGKQQHFYSTSQAIRLIDEIQPSNAYHSIEEISSQVKSSLQENDHSEALQFFILSDFQKSQFKNLSSLNDSIWKLKLLKLQEANPSSNLAIDSVWFENPILQPGFDQNLKVVVRNYGKENIDHVSIQLKINNELNTAQEIAISALEKKELTFVIRPANKGLFEGNLSLDIGQPYFDNQLFFSFKVDEAIKVLVIGKSNNKNIFEKLYQDSIYKLAFTNLNQLSYGELANYNLVILNQLKSFPSGLSTAVSGNLKLGKNVVFIPDFENLNSSQSFLENFGLRGFSPALNTNIKLNKIYWKDLLFDNVFTAEPKNSQLPIIKKYFKARAGNCLLEMENGDCILSRNPHFEGQMLVFHTNFEQSSGDLAKHSILVPVMLNAALFSSPKQALYNSSGRSSGQQFQRKYTESDYPLILKVGEKEIIPPQRNLGNKTEIFSLPSEIKPGIYPVIENEQQIGKIAVNIDPRESDWSFWTNPEIKEVLANSDAEVLDLENINLSQIISNNYNGYPLWHWFLASVLLFLIIEITLLKLWN